MMWRSNNNSHHIFALMYEQSVEHLERHLLPAHQSSAAAAAHVETGERDDGIHGQSKGRDGHLASGMHETW
jgi:hypothetical protein